MDNSKKVLDWAIAIGGGLFMLAIGVIATAVAIWVVVQLF